MYEEVKGRPLFLVAEELGIERALRGDGDLRRAAQDDIKPDCRQP